MPVTEGRKAPAFTLKDQNGDTHKLADYAGKNVILYFYPRDDTSGCTAEFSRYVQISLTDTYTPVWAKVAFGSPFNYSVVRTVQIG